MDAISILWDAKGRDGLGEGDDSSVGRCENWSVGIALAIERVVDILERLGVKRISDASVSAFSSPAISLSFHVINFFRGEVQSAV